MTNRDNDKHIETALSKFGAIINEFDKNISKDSEELKALRQNVYMLAKKIDIIKQKEKQYAFNLNKNKEYKKLLDLI